MGWFALKGWQPLTDAGAIVANGTLTFSRTGTSTAKNIYSNKALSAALSNPLSLDSAGRITTNIWMLEDEGYRVVLKNSSGTTIWTSDEVFALAPAYDEITRRRKIIRSPLDHGAVGDGVADDATALTAALAQLSTDGGGILDLEGNTYRCDSTLTVPSNVCIRNGKIDFSGAALSAGLSGVGTAGTPTAISSAPSDGYTATVASTSGLTAGDLVRLRSSDAWASGHNTAELFAIQNISGLNVTLDGFIVGGYSTDPFLEEITPLADIRLEDLFIVSPSGGYAIDFELAARVKLRNVRWQGTGSTQGVRLLSCYDVSIEGCVVEPKTTTEGSGIIIGDASTCVRISDCFFSRSVCAVEIGNDFGTYDGLCKDIVVRDCEMRLCAQLASIGDGAETVRIIDNTTESDPDPASANKPAILVGSGNYIEISGNTFIDPEGPAVTVTVDQTVTRMVIQSNTVVRGQAQVFRFTDTSGTITYCRIADNIALGPTGAAVSIAGTAFTRLDIVGNRFTSGSGSHIIDANSADGLGYCTISNNNLEIVTTPSTAIRVGGNFASNVSIQGNRISGTTQASQIGISVLDTDIAHVTIRDNVIFSVATGITSTVRDTTICGNDITLHASGVLGISAVGTSVAPTALISGNRVAAAGGTATGAGIFVDEFMRFQICNNTVDVTLTALEVDNTTQEFTGGVISGNYLAGDDTGIEVDASDATGSHSLTISGNYVESAGGAGEYVIWVTGIIVGIAINGNTLRRTNDTDANIRVAGDAAGNVSMITVVGNAIHNGTYGIEVANNDAASTYHDANAFSSLATANDNGAANFAVPVEST
jgi:hypothetical protein